MQARSYSVEYEDAVPDFVSHWMSDLFEANLIRAAMLNQILEKYESLNVLHGALLEELTSFQLVKTFPAFCGT